MEWYLIIIGMCFLLGFVSLFYAFKTELKKLSDRIAMVEDKLNIETDVRRLLLQRLGLIVCENVWLEPLEYGDLKKIDLLLKALGYEYLPPKAKVEKAKLIKKRK